MPHYANPVVKTPAGAVRGVRDASGEFYRAIPYAAAPIGARRFAPPVPHPGWSGVRDGTQPPPTAPQPVRDFGGLDMTPYFGPGWVRGEEYLTVDVSTPATDDGRRPVMVFVHGGGFVAGSSRAALYDGDAFARDGIVLVTVNYRLGIPGFLDLEGAPANRGLLDVLAALGWIRATVATFGGDPDNVTIFGQSAGATLVGALLATPEAKGLFRRAIIQSGSGTFTPEQARRVTTTVAATLGVEPTAEAFAAIPDERFLEIRKTCSPSPPGCTRPRRPRSPRTARHCRTRHRASCALRCSGRRCSEPARPAWRKPTHGSRAAAHTSTRSGIARRP
ncbi:Carboxylesterase family protein [Actinopolyspora alba]|uniref:Carboxylic ester hydrolase n=1 Tax=Actinopolyspora alba TaxID=673379 RepID=A0A1I1X0H1_9ACTN|nr:carboxylesterase family protein [Actinopolyspora alba]SFE00944.1 Carboxylesterase family protein [Actinopolyspora alba]